MAWKLPPDQSTMGGVYGVQDLPLWLQSGMEQSPPAAPYQPGDFQRAGPQMRPVGIGETIARALLPERNEQGIPNPWGMGDIVNAALWAMPGMRGLKRPSPVSPQQPNLGGDSLVTAMRRDVIDRGRSERPVSSYDLESTIPQTIATSRKAQAGELRDRWNKAGQGMDFEEVWSTPAGDRAWVKEVQAWNKQHGTNFDPDNLPLNSSTQGIWDAFDQKYLAGKKAKFPGVTRANEWFETEDPSLMVHLKKGAPAAGLK